MSTLQISIMPELQISNLTQLHWAVENWQNELIKCRINTDAAYDIFVEESERGISSDERQMLLATIDVCEAAQHYAYEQLGAAKLNLLATMN